VSPIVRAWLAFAAVAAGIIHLALAVNSPVSVALALLGVFEFGWGLFVMAAARLVAPRVTIAGAFVAVAASVGLLFVPDGPSAIALLIAAVFAFFVATTIAISLRRSPRIMPSTRRYVLGLLAGGIVVAALTVPALAATTFDNVQVSPGDFVDEHGH
jgi:hypothetical protein